jgi:hypothetical protein
MVDAAVMAVASTQASNIALSRSVTINRNTAALKQNAAIANRRCSALRSASTRVPIVAKTIRIKIIKLKPTSNGMEFNTCDGIDASKRYRALGGIFELSICYADTAGAKCAETAAI